MRVKFDRLRDALIIVAVSGCVADNAFAQNQQLVFTVAARPRIDTNTRPGRTRINRDKKPRINTDKKPRINTDQHGQETTD
jgi:hypothetical protein